MIFAIVFGLSMDYEVFLLARMHEEWRRGPATRRRAIREGLATTGRVVTAAAAIMIVVFGAFLLSPERMLQQFGLGLAVAVLLDAVVIRCLIVPAVMQMLGPGRGGCRAGWAVCCRGWRSSARSTDRPRTWRKPRTRSTTGCGGDQCGELRARHVRGSGYSSVWWWWPPAWSRPSCSSEEAAEAAGAGTSAPRVTGI